MPLNRNGSEKTKCKARPVPTTTSPHKIAGRSPLSTRNVDYNSPRAIVQRKQAGKLSIQNGALQMKGSSKYKILQEDKENVN